MIDIATAKRKYRCSDCKQIFVIEAYQRDFDMFDDGMAAQDAIPYLKPWERELMNRGRCEPCFHKAFVLIHEE